MDKTPKLLAEVKRNGGSLEIKSRLTPVFLKASKLKEGDLVEFSPSKIGNANEKRR